MDNKLNYQELIVKAIEYNDGLKVTQLALKVMEIINPVSWDNEAYLNALEGLIHDGVIIQVSFETPMNGTKVMYFPQGTKFLVGN